MANHYFEDIWLFGSYARGDQSLTSDIDVLVINDVLDQDDPYLTNILKKKKKLCGSLSFSHYSKAGISDLIRRGALFAWHIRLEGISLSSMNGWLADELKMISPYQTYFSDLNILQVMVDEARQSLQCDSHTLNMEASVLSVAVRNASMMTAFILGHPDFSSNAIFNLRDYKLAASIFDRICDHTIVDLIGARLESERGLNQGRQWTQSELINIANEIASWLQQLSLINLKSEGYHATPISA